MGNIMIFDEIIIFKMFYYVQQLAGDPETVADININDQLLLKSLFNLLQKEITFY